MIIYRNRDRDDLALCVTEVLTVRGLAEIILIGLFVGTVITIAGIIVR